MTFKIREDAWLNSKRTTGLNKVNLYVFVRKLFVYNHPFSFNSASVGLREKILSILINKRI